MALLHTLLVFACFVSVSISCNRAPSLGIQAALKLRSSSVSDEHETSNQSKIPLFYSFQLNEADSVKVLDLGTSYYNKIMKDDTLRESLAGASSCIFPDSGARVFSQCGPNKKFQVLHCTTKYTGRGSVPGAAAYVNNATVKSYLNKTSNLMVYGLMVTPRTIGARVVLTEEQLKVYGEDDHPTLSKNIAKLYKPVPDCKENLNLGMNFENETPIPTDNETFAECPYEPTQCTESEVNTNFLSSVSNFTVSLPTRDHGRRTHLTLATSQGVGAVVTGFDNVDIENTELEIMNANKVQDLEKYSPYIVPLENGDVIAKYKNGVVVIYLKQWFSVESTFRAIP